MTVDIVIFAKIGKKKNHLVWPGTDFKLDDAFCILSDDFFDGSVVNNGLIFMWQNL